eukprot:203604_1
MAQSLCLLHVIYAPTQYPYAASGSHALCAHLVAHFGCCFQSNPVAISLDPQSASLHALAQSDHTALRFNDDDPYAPYALYITSSIRTLSLSSLPLRVRN